MAVGTEGLVAALQGVADWAQATEASMPTLLARTLLWALPVSLLPPPMPVERSRVLLEATPEEVDDKLAEVLLAERRAEAASAARAQAEAEAQRQGRLTVKAAADAAAAKEESDESESEAEEAEPDDPNDTTWSAPATAAPVTERLSRPRLFSDDPTPPTQPPQKEGLDAAKEKEEDDDVDALDLAAAEAAALAKAARLKKKAPGAGAGTVQSVLTAAAKGLSPELAAVMMRAVSETPSMRAAEAAVAAAQAAAAAAEAAAVRIREQLGAPYPGREAVPDEAAQMRAETEAERVKLLRATGAKARAAAERAASEVALDEELAGGREGRF